MGLGSSSLDYEPPQSVPTSLKHSLDMDLHIFCMQTNAKLVNTNVELLKTDMTTLKGDFIALETDIKLEMVATREPPSTRFYRLLV